MSPTGRLYYIDHTSQITTWEKPRFKEIKPTVDPAPATPTPVEQVGLKDKDYVQYTEFHTGCITGDEALGGEGGGEGWKILCPAAHPPPHETLNTCLSFTGV